jgi:hypothetical protein
MDAIWIFGKGVGLAVIALGAVLVWFRPMPGLGAILVGVIVFARAAQAGFDPWSITPRRKPDA